MQEYVWAALLGFYVVVVLYATKIPYNLMVNKGVEHIRAVYYNRKIVHVFAGGVISLAIPYVFTSPMYPFFCGLAFTLLIGSFHWFGAHLTWFQTEENQNDVKFALMWFLSISILWYLLNDPWLAIMPSLFMAFGDGITGVVRNRVVRQRSKHPIGNVFMFIVSAPLGYFCGIMADGSFEWWGVLAAFVATLVERYEFGPIDDNILITIASSAIIFLGMVL
ncbi:MAG: hypothetical protein O2866_01000 [archaeon]|nr:hypothetical protein [archaeon]MDA1167444.1 hypothetical protein [archaeon]